MKPPLRCRGRSRHQCSFNRQPVRSPHILGPPPDDYTDPYNQVSSQEHVPLVANPSPFQHRDFCDDEYEDHILF